MTQGTPTNFVKVEGQEHPFQAKYLKIFWIFYLDLPQNINNM